MSDAWVDTDLGAVPLADLFTMHSRIQAELRERRVLRTSNAPVGDIAEWLVWKAFGGCLEDNSNASYDISDSHYGRVQVKARTLSTPEKKGQRQASVFRSDKFHFAALVLLASDDYSVQQAVMLPVDAVKQRWSWNAHVRGWRLMMNGPTMNHPAAVDISQDLRLAARQMR